MASYVMLYEDCYRGSSSNEILHQKFERDCIGITDGTDISSTPLRWPRVML
jgi:hypothetical protein